MNTKWTVSKQNSINITSTVKGNYGFYGKKFIEGLLKKTQEELNRLYDESEQIINSMTGNDDPISDRIQTRLSLIRMTAVLVKEIMGLNIDVDYITNFLAENEKIRQKELSIEKQAYEDIIQYVVAHYSSFVKFNPVSGLREKPQNTVLGRIYDSKESGRLLCLLPNVFDALMKKYNDIEAIITKWKSEGMLVTDNDGRNTKLVRVFEKMNASRCYCLVLKRGENDELDKILQEEEIDCDAADERERKRLATKKYLGTTQFVENPKEHGEAPVVLTKEIVSQWKNEDRFLKQRVGDNKLVLELTEQTELEEIKYEDSNNIDEIFGE